MVAAYRAAELLVDWSTIDDWKWTASFNTVLSLFLGSLLVGGFVFPHWREGIEGTRLSGGTNPNSAGFYAFIILMWITLVSTLRGERTFTDNATIVFALIIILWSGSRSALFSALTFLVPVGIVSVAYMSGSRAKLLPRLTLVVLAVLAAGGAVALTAPTGVDEELERMWTAYLTRLELAQDENVNTRLDTWNYLLTEWGGAPWTGRLGWYFTSKELNTYGIGETLSSHSFYVRALAEVGLVGLAVAMLLPCYGIAVAVGFGGLSGNGVMACSLSSRARFTIVCAILALFVREVGEDGYLTDFISPTTGFLLFSIALVERLHVLRKI
jgi:hypothetical protein